MRKFRRIFGVYQMKHITVDVESISYSGESQKHFDDVCRELGISYEKMKGIAVAGRVYLYNVNIPEGIVLPKYWELGISEFILRTYF